MVARFEEQSEGRDTHGRAHGRGEARERCLRQRALLRPDEGNDAAGADEQLAQHELDRLESGELRVAVHDAEHTPERMVEPRVLVQLPHTSGPPMGCAKPTRGLAAVCIAAVVEPCEPPHESEDH